MSLTFNEDWTAAPSNFADFTPGKIAPDRNVIDEPQVIRRVRVPHQPRNGEDRDGTGCVVDHPGSVIGTVNQVGNFEGNLTPPDNFDGGCVDNSFLWCDNLVNPANNNVDVMQLMTRDFANMVLTMAYDTKVMSASGSAVIDKKTALSQETGSRHIASS